MPLTRFAFCLILAGSVWVVPNAIAASQHTQGAPKAGLAHTVATSAWRLDAAKNAAAIRPRAQVAPEVSQLPGMLADLRSRIATLDRRADPLGWARAQHDLGTVLGGLGRHEGDRQRLEEAIAAYNNALQIFSLYQTPGALGYTHLNLGRSQLTLGEWDAGTHWLEDAVSSLYQAVTTLPRQERFFEWASAHADLGKALSLLGERRGDRQLLEDGVLALRVAVEGLGQGRPSEAWVNAQTNLGMALMNVARHGKGTLEVEQAVAAYRLALEKTPRDQALVLWAHIQSNLGYALRFQGTREPGGLHLEDAIASFEVARAAYREAGEPQDEQRMERQIDQVMAMIEARGDRQ